MEKKPRLRVHFRLTSDWSADLDYDELAQAWQDDADAHPEAPREALKAEMEALARNPELMIRTVGENADSAVDELLTARGYETDSSLACIEEIEIIGKDNR